ncbi:MAG: PD40 domain-containing protein [Acidobacteria bacterium]|nr:PD40 domain-containing protein [Acidobacteriota bacterium]
MRFSKWTIGLFAASALLLAAENGYKLFQQALAKERADADPRAAIRIYERVVKESANDRKLAAQALIRMAECYNKLGDTEARKLYERVLRDYADQKESATTARVRLGSAGSPARAKGDRVVWTGRDVIHAGGSVSPDGRYISYTDWFAAGNLMVHDLVSGTDRVLTDNKNWNGQGSSGLGSAISRDGKQVAYAWLNYQTRRIEIRIVSLEGAAQSRRVMESAEIAHASVGDWSPDQKLLAVTLERRDRSKQIGIVGVQDGALRVLKSVSWRGPNKLFFSPDGKYLAYDLPADDTALQRDVFVIAVDGSQDTALVTNAANDAVAGWSPDGRELLFTSDRTGANGLWSLAVFSGKAAAAPKLLKPDIGTVWPLGLTSSGALHLAKDTSTEAMQVAPIDLAAGKLQGTPSAQAYRASGPAWSPDGKYLAYKIQSDGLNILAIRSVESGEVKKVPLSLHYFTVVRWSPDSRWLITGARDRKGSSAIYRLDPATGDASVIAKGSHTSHAEFSPDGKKIYSDYHPEQRRALVEHDLNTGRTRSVYQATEPARPGRFGLSPDGRYAATVLMLDRDRTAADSSGNTTVLLLIPIDGGAPRELLRVSRPEVLEAFDNLAWTPDSKALIVMKRTGEKKELWKVSLEGGQARKLDIDVSGWLGFRLHPNGRQVVFFAGERSEEIWSLENFRQFLVAK